MAYTVTMEASIQLAKGITASADKVEQKFDHLLAATGFATEKVFDAMEMGAEVKHREHPNGTFPCIWDIKFSEQVSGLLTIVES